MNKKTDTKRGMGFFTEETIQNERKHTFLCMLLRLKVKGRGNHIKIERWRVKA